MKGFGGGVAFATLTAVIWGGQFVVGKSALSRVDPYPLTTIRYALAAMLLIALLAAVEGRRAFALEGHGWRLFGLGSLGFAGFNLIAYTGLEHTTPQSAALVVALAPLVTAIALWVRDGVRPPRVTAVAMAVALVGVALVISRGDPASLVDGSVGAGDLLVLIGVTSFVLYTLGAARYRDFSPLRYTTLTAALGWLTIAGATALGAVAGLVPMPSSGDVVAVSPEILYLVIPGAVIAVLTWNASIPRIGAQNTALIGNLIPVTTFVIEIARGYRPVPLELVGAALTIGALAANNLLVRRAAARAPRPVERAERREPELEAA